MWLLLVAVGLLPTWASARECNATLSTIHTQADIDALAQNCTSLSRGLTISSEYSGPVLLPNIVNISSWYIRQDSRDPLRITAFEMPDLEEANEIQLMPLTDIESWSVPKLTTARGVSLEIPSYLEELDFPKLNSTSDLRVGGNLTNVSFDSLRAVDGEVKIYNTDSPLMPAETRMNLSFPALESAFGLRVWGNISSLALPQLTKLGIDKPGYNPLPSLFSNSGPPLPLDLPNLSSVEERLHIKGNFSSLSLPAFKNITDSLEITATSPLAIDLPLEDATGVFLVGQIESVSLPNLRNWTTLYVRSDLPFDCEGFIDRFNGTTSGPAPGEVRCEVTGEDRDQEDEDEGNLATRRIADLGGVFAAAITGIVIGHVVI
ncbi:uncharacterized protein DSM5745_04416 [Aspergillus mulundensis]|uniref:GPI anchored protein n=1 Tax=Aspergillus mulundensis TaxID=1810919 RepID=A0A3D8SCM1_9EURO|nr:hypothetical protein DSM5745_04416 [Aspergillus mulundensis]RDW84090.1 hypothetical protein DSM5745_04416 [Aspergillus mulundensis]